MSKMTFFLLLVLWLTACVSQTPEPLKQPVSPLIPIQDSILLDNQWRLTEMIHNGTRGGFASIEPVLLIVEPDILSVQACNSASFLFDTKGVDNTNEYRLINGDGTLVLCDNGGTEQESFFSQALRATNGYEIVGDTLIFSGKNAQLVFVIDNEATKPPDWQ